MVEDEWDNFLKWHQEREEVRLCTWFQKQLKEYCDSELDILISDCIELRKQLLESEHIDPFQHMTITNLFIGIYRSKYMTYKTIGVIKGDKKEKYTKQSIACFNTFGNNITRTINDSEVTVCGSKVYGYDAITKTVYQYHWRFWYVWKK